MYKRQVQVLRQELRVGMQILMYLKLVMLELEQLQQDSSLVKMLRV